MNVCIVRLVFWLVSSEHCRGPPLNLWALQGPTIECMKDWSRYSTHCTQCHLNSTKISYLWILRIQDKTIVTTHRVRQSKFSVEKLMNQTVSNSNLESTLTQTKLLTDRSNDEASITWETSMEIMSSKTQNFCWLVSCKCSPAQSGCSSSRQAWKSAGRISGILDFNNFNLCVFSI